MRNRLLVAAVGATLLLGGCAPQAEDEYPADTAQSLKAQVLAVSESAAAGDLFAAAIQLDELVASVSDARARGSIGQEKHDAIMAAVALVRADLQHALQAQLEQSETPVEAAVEPPVEAETVDDTSDGNSGNNEPPGRGNKGGNGNRGNSGKGD